jgi:hypothetical protein
VSVKNPWGIVIIALGGIWLSWSTKYIRKIVGNVALWLHLRHDRQLQQTDTSETPTESTSLLGGGSERPTSKGAQPLAKVLKEKSGIRDLCYAMFFGKNLSTAAKARLLFFTIIVILLASCILLGGYYLAQIKVDGPARLASDKCGLWLFEGGKRSEAATRARMLDLEKEERAAQFAEDCYGQSSSAASRCRVLYRPTLPVSNAIYTNDCPFSQDICRLNQTVTFKTPTIDARELGINSPSTPMFRRSTACTPLSMNYPYIQNRTENGTTTFTYYYGRKHGDGEPVNHTYSTVGDPWDRLAPIYDVFAYSSNADGSHQPVWEPHPDLTHPRYSTITIVFVSSLRILYEDNSDDPIFPADEEFYLPGDPKAWFRNSDPRARPLACINTIEVCAADGRICWNLNEPTSNSTIPDNTSDFVLLYSSLYKTDIYYSLAKRQGRSLLAQKRVSQYFSAALGDDHWVTEIENWVWTALARTSINAWSVASGEDSIHEGRGGFTEVTKSYDLCGRYKYNPQGYQSLRFMPLMVVILWLPFLWILSWDWKPIERRMKEPLDRFEELIRTSLLRLSVHTARSRSSSQEGASSQPAPNITGSPETTVPVEDTLELQQGESSEAESPATVTMPQQHNVQSSNTGSTISQPPTASDSETSNEDGIEWERLVLHQLIYFAYYTLQSTVLFLWWAVRSLWGKIRWVRDDANPRNV